MPMANGRASRPVAPRTGAVPPIVAARLHRPLLLCNLSPCGTAPARTTPALRCSLASAPPPRTDLGVAARELLLRRHDAAAPAASQYR
ncbi:hypothetical protein ACP4OV_014832 [Aristida adscensionis]